MQEEAPRIKTDTSFSVRRSEISGVPVIAVSGEVDLSTAPELREMLLPFAESSPPLVVADLTDVTFVDSTALGVLVTSLKHIRAGGGDLRLVVTQPHISKVLDITGLSDVFSVYTTTAEAVKA